MPFDSPGGARLLLSATVGYAKGKYQRMAFMDDAVEQAAMLSKPANLSKSTVATSSPMIDGCYSLSRTPRRSGVATGEMVVAGSGVRGLTEPGRLQEIHATRSTERLVRLVLYYFQRHTLPIY